MDYEKIYQIHKHIPQDEFMRGVIMANGSRVEEWAVVGPKCLDQLAHTYVRFGKFVEPRIRKILIDIEESNNV